MSATTLVSLFCLLLLAAYWLHALWRVLASGNGSMQASFVAAYLIIAVGARHALPKTLLIPVWSPFLYGYAWCAAGGALWLISQAHVSRRGIALDASSPRLSAFLLAQLVLTLGVGATTHLTQGRSAMLYFALPPLMAVLGMLLYPVFVFLAKRRRDCTVGWSPLILFGVATPLAGVALAERLVPLLLRHF